MTDRTAKRLSWRALTVAAGLVLAPTASLAQAAATPPASGAAAATPNIEDLQHWTKVCNPDPTTNQQGCAVFYRLFANATTIIAQISLSYLVDDPNTILLSAWVPSTAGVFLDQGLALSIDGADPSLVPYRLCDPQICIAEDNVPPAFITALKAGGELTMTVVVPDQTNGTQSVAIPISLIGFTAAYDGPGMSPDEVQAAQDTLNQAMQDRIDEARQQLIDQQNQLDTNPTPAASP